MRYTVSDGPTRAPAPCTSWISTSPSTAATGLPRGIYHYDPAGHALTLINEHEPDVDELLAGATVLIGPSQAAGR